MALTKQRYAYIDFSTEQQPAIIQKNLSAVMTATDAQVNAFKVNGQPFEWLQIGAAASTACTPGAAGWRLPMSTTTARGLAICQGSESTSVTPMKFTTGTDAFFIKVKLTVTTLAQIIVGMVGFREAGTTQVTTSAALALTDYDHKAYFGVQAATTGATRLYSSTAAGVDTSTTPTGTPIVTATAVTWEVRVGTNRIVDVYVDGVKDVLIDAADITLTTAKVLVPHMIFISDTGGAVVDLETYECGLYNA